MASNFRIYVQRNSNDLHIQLEGDFDGTSAHQPPVCKTDSR